MIYNENLPKLEKYLAPYSARIPELPIPIKITLSALVTKLAAFLTFSSISRFKVRSKNSILLIAGNF